jgi:hypothetical protein
VLFRSVGAAVRAEAVPTYVPISHQICSCHVLLSSVMSPASAAAEPVLAVSVPATAAVVCYCHSRLRLLLSLYLLCLCLLQPRAAAAEPVLAVSVSATAAVVCCCCCRDHAPTSQVLCTLFCRQSGRQKGCLKLSNCEMHSPLAIFVYNVRRDFRL